VAHISRTKTKAGDTRWAVKYRAPDGRQRERWFTSRRAAERYETTIAADVLRGLWVDPRRSTRTIADVVAQWRAANPGKRASTLAADDSALSVHVLPALGTRAVGSVTPADVQTLVNAMARRLQPRTVRRNYGVLRAVLRFAEQSDVIARTPCRGIKLPGMAPVRRPQLSPADVAKLAIELGEEHGPMAWLGAVLGLRWGEVAALRVGRVDLLKRTLAVAEAISRSSTGTPVLGPPKSDAGYRTLSVPAALCDLLANCLVRRRLTGADVDALVFVAPDGGPLHYSNWRQRVWVPACERAGLDGLGFHDLRRANATALVADGVDLKTAQARLGHSDPRLTLAVYAQATSEADRAAADKLGARFLPARSAV
jgi:integrase